VRFRVYWAGAVVAALVFLRTSASTVLHENCDECDGSANVQPHTGYLFCLAKGGVAGEWAEPETPMEGVIRPKDSREPRRGNDERVQSPKDKRAEWRKARAEAAALARRATGAVDAGGGGELGDSEVAGVDGREGS